MDLNNKTVVLTGAASGIGRALAIQLSALGCELALVDRDIDGLKATVSKLTKTSAKVSTHIVDLSDRDAVLALPVAVLAEHATVHILINNAGVAIGGNFTEVSTEHFDWLMRINFQSVVDLTRGFLPTLLGNQERGKLVNVSSLFGMIAPAGQTAYSASKFAVRGFSNALAHELEGSNVDMLVVHPGGVSTSIADSAIVPAGIDASEVERQKRAMNKMLKLPSEQAATVIINAMQRDARRVLVGTDAKIISLLERLMPIRYWGLLSSLMKAS